MILNDQLDNEKMSFVYQIDLFKDDLEEMEENYLRLTREHRDKSKVNFLEKKYPKIKTNKLFRLLDLRPTETRLRPNTGRL